MAAATLAIGVANSSLSEAYFSARHIYIGPLSLQHWINDALMSAFFLLVGLEIKREMLDGHLSSWSNRILPGAAAAGGMLVPALIYIGFNLDDPTVLRGWAIPTATDIAFALGVLSLLGRRVPASLKIFLTAVAIIDDLGAVIVIAFFYTEDLNFLALGAAAGLGAVLAAFNYLKIIRLWPYLVAGPILWSLVLLSGVHATLAGVMLAMTIPQKSTRDTPEPDSRVSPLHTLEHALRRPVDLLIVPIFGFANAGVSFAGVTPSVLFEPLSLGVAAGLLIGKLIGVFATVAILVRSGLADLPATATWGQMFGVALLCGIGFTMSLFIGLLAFDEPGIQDRVRLGIFAGSVLAGIAGYAVLRLAERKSRSV